MKRRVTCKQKRRAQPAIYATPIKMKASPETSKQRVVAMMYRVSYRDDQRGVAMIKICEERLRYVVQRMESFELRLEGAIDIVDRLLGIDLEQIGETKMRLDIEPHGICERADRILDYGAAMQSCVSLPQKMQEAIRNPLEPVSLF